MAERWILRRTPSPAFLQKVPDLHPLLAKVLYARKFDTPEAARTFLTAPKALGDPFTLPDMPTAVERIREAIARQERIAIYGDFDVDGITATALLVSALERLGAEVVPYIPDRFDEGYGLNKGALEILRKQGTGLVITVDCGIRSPDEARYAREIGLDLIITDHHTAPADLPPALAVINPKREDSAYPFGELAGVGVAYQLAQALFSAWPGHSPEEVDDWLDLVSLGTVADIVPLLGENRFLVRAGLARFRQGVRPGISALMEISGVNAESLGGQDIAFRLAPRLNATGRLEHALLSYRLLMARSLEEALPLATTLNDLNQERQRLLEAQLAEAETHIDADTPFLFVEGEAYHEGIVGLVASRLVEGYYRPAFVMRRGPEFTRGSARSVQNFHITRALDACAELLIRYGGHAQAAGFTLLSRDITSFRERLQAYCAEHLKAEHLQRARYVDAIIRLEDLDGEGVAALRALEPFGAGNPEPALAVEGAEIISARPFGAEGQHTRLIIRQGERYAEAVAFRQRPLGEVFRPGARVDLIFSPELRSWQGQETLQLVLSAARPASH